MKRRTLGVAVPGWDQPGVDTVAEDVRPPQLRNVVVKPLQIGQAAPENDSVGIEDVDHRGQRARQPVLVALQGRPRLSVSLRGAAGDLFRGPPVRGTKVSMQPAFPQ